MLNNLNKFSTGGAKSLGGSASNEIYSLSKSNLASWELIGMTTGSRYAHISILIPKSFLNCNNSVQDDDWEFIDTFGNDTTEENDSTEENELSEEITTTKISYITEDESTEVNDAN